MKCLELQRGQVILRNKNEKNYIKKGGGEVVENNKTRGRRAFIEWNLHGIGDDEYRKYI